MGVRRAMLVGALLLAGCSNPTPEALTVGCKDPLAGCRIDAGLEVKFSRTPVTMQPFVLEVRSGGRELFASFQMQGMEMGLNRYRLLWAGDHWRAEVMLPACVHGRRDWLMRLEVDGRVYALPFAAG